MKRKLAQGKTTSQGLIANFLNKDIKSKPVIIDLDEEKKTINQPGK